MKKIKIENGKLYSSRMPLCEGIDVFEIVEKIPENYFIWNIGENMGTDEYIPLAEDLHPEDKDNYEINCNTLKAIKLSVEDVKLMRRAANYGIVSKATAEKALKNKRRGYMSDRKRAEAEKTIDVFRKITVASKESRIFEFYKNDLKKLGRKHGQIRMNVIEYTCSFPKIDPFKMAQDLVRDGFKVVFDDSSISQKKTNRKRKKYTTFNRREFL